MGSLSWFNRFGMRRSEPSPKQPAVPAAAPCKWLPAIETDYCTGCGQCVQVCPRQCLQMVWSFATLVRSEHCDGDGRCVEACPEDVIRMAPVPLGDAPRRPLEPTMEAFGAAGSAAAGFPVESVKVCQPLRLPPRG